MAIVFSCYTEEEPATFIRKRSQFNTSLVMGVKNHSQLTLATSRPSSIVTLCGWLAITIGSGTAAKMSMKSILLLLAVVCEAGPLLTVNWPSLTTQVTVKSSQ